MKRLMIRVRLGRICSSNDLNFKTIRKDMDREFSAQDIKTEKEGK